MVILLLVSLIAVLLFLQLPLFGSLPKEQDALKISASPNYKDGRFQNLSPTPDLTEGASFYKVLFDFLFQKSKRNRPGHRLPSMKTDLLQVSKQMDFMVWMGHSSYFLQLDGKTILVDPVFSGSASPLWFTTKSFPGSDRYVVDDLPIIDFLFISHDHWDHLDYQTIKKIRPKVKRVVTGLGVGAHLKRWGYKETDIVEKDWYEEVQLEEDFKVIFTPGRHFSGRSFRRNKSLWTSFVIQTPSYKIFLGGDSGYDSHFASIGSDYGPFDLAFLECGQYNSSWKYIHMMPEEVIQAGLDLKAEHVMIVHWAKFSLALHDWDEPIIRVLKESKRKGIKLIHPMIGESVALNNMLPGKEWWN